MLQRYKADGDGVRSAILTLKSRLISGEQRYAGMRALRFPLLVSAMSFSKTLSDALSLEYHDLGIDIMTA